MAFYKKFLELGCWFFHIIGTLALTTIVVVVTCGIIARNLGNPITWIEEISTLMFITLAFSGACVSSYKKKHIIVDFFSQKLPEKTARLVNILLNLLIIVFVCLVFVGGIYLHSRVRIVLTVILDIPRSVFFFPLIMASAYMVLFYIYDTILLLAGYNGDKHPEGRVYS